MADRTQRKWLRRVGALALFLLLLVLGAAAIAATFSHVITHTDEVAGRYDIFRYIGPLSFYVDHAIAQGELPLWNPLTYCGLPLAGNPQSFIFSPPNLLRSVLTAELTRIPTPDSTLFGLTLMMALHLLLAVVGTWYLARAHGMSGPACFAAAIAFGFSAIMVRRMGEFHFITTLAWLPLLLVAVKALIDARTLRAKCFIAVLGALLLAMSILGGFIQIMNHLALAAGLYALLYAFLAPLSSEGLREKKQWLDSGLALALFFTLGALLAAILLIPTAELAAFSAREKGEAVRLFNDLRMWDLDRLYQSFVVFAGMKYEAETLRNAGIGALLLALAGLFHPRKRHVLVFALLYVFLLDCAIGPPMPMATLVEWLTPFAISAYSRAYDFALLPLALLTGLGVDALWRRTGPPRRRMLLALLLIYAAAGSIVPLYFWTQTDSYYLPVGLLVVAIPTALLLAALVLTLAPLPRAVRFVLAATLPLLLFAETLTWNQVYFPWLVQKHIEDAPAEPVAMPQVNQRGVDPIPNRWLYQLRPAMNGVDPLHLAAMRGFLSGPPRETRQTRLVTDWEPTAENHRGNLYLKRFFWLSRQYAEGPAPGKLEVFPSATTIFLTAPPALETPQVARETLPRRSISEQAAMQHIPDAAAKFVGREGQQFHKTLRFELPNEHFGAEAGSAGALHSSLFLTYRATGPATISTMVHDTEGGRSQWAKRHRVAPAGTQLRTLDIPLPDFHQARAEITVELTGIGSFDILSAAVHSDLQDEDRLIEILDFDANEVMLRVGSLDAPRILTFLNAWYPGWRVYVDGEARPLLHANDLFQAVELGPGLHTVRFAYEPASAYVGASISLAALLMSLLVLVLLRPRLERRRYGSRRHRTLRCHLAECRGLQQRGNRKLPD